MNFEVKKENGVTIIKLYTRLDSTTSGEFSEVLEKEIPNVEESLVLDFKNVDFISSMGLRVLVAAYKNLDGKKMVIENANSSVKEIFSLAGLLNIFTLE